MRQEEFRDRVEALIEKTFPMLDVMFDDVTFEESQQFQAGVAQIVGEVVREKVHELR